MNDERKIYMKAIKRIDELVDEVLHICNEVADDNHYEREWVLDQFRSHFNRARREST
ncbi:hypothetical protein [Paenibacillus taichungensis]|uniref:hypothetical protein n=1 Tax=Paenibacillus taichungensis TaxID=484184 RepID=UPI0039A28855